MNYKQKNPLNFSRRDFLGTMAATAALTIVPRSVLGGRGYTPPSDLVNLAGIGVGARGGTDIQLIATPDVPIQSPTGTRYTRFLQPYSGIQPPPVERRPSQSVDPAPPTFKHANIYALCDVDHDYAAHILAGYPNAKKYKDFREMIDKEKEIDAVLIATPDHTHAAIASYAMKAGKHAFVEKPLTKTIYESRFLADLAKKTGLVTQMGNQGHNAEGMIQTVEWIQSGAIGNVREVHMWTNVPNSTWRQGHYPRPEGVPVPGNLNYDVWLGPAPQKPYHPDVVHFNWRGLRDYGTGAMGDYGAHIFDAPIWALNLGMPTKIQAKSSPYSEDYLPQSELITYEFPARGNMPSVKATWYDGGLKPPRPEGLEPERALRECLYIGDRGMIMHGTHGAAPELIPRNPDFREPPKTLNRPSSVYVDFIEAIKEGRKAANDFEIAAKLNEIMLLANIAVVSQRLNITLEYDAANMKIANCPEANEYFHYEYRSGWSL